MSCRRTYVQGVPAVPPNEEYLRRHAEDAARNDNTQYGDLSGELNLRKTLAENVNEVYQCQGNVSFQVRLFTELDPLNQS